MAPPRKPGYCSDCAQWLPLDRFNKHKGRPNGIQQTCRDCQKIRMRRWREGLSEERKEAYRAMNSKATAVYRGRPENAIKRQAHLIVLAAVRSGFLKRKGCEVCGKLKHVHAHHDDYTKPLDIVWLCAEHHKERHAKLRGSDTLRECDPSTFPSA